MKLICGLLFCMMALHASAGEVAGRKAPAPARPSEPSILQPLQDALCDNFFGDDFYKGQNNLKGKFRDKCRKTTSFDQIDQVLKAERVKCQEGCGTTYKDNICLKQACLEKCEDEEASAALSKKSFDLGENIAEGTEAIQRVMEITCLIFDPDFEKYLEQKILPQQRYNSESLTRLKGVGTLESRLVTRCSQARDEDQAKKALKDIEEACIASCKASAKRKVAEGLKEAAVKCAEDACASRCAGFENTGIKALDMFGKGQAASL